jgi:hypothetical protein
VEDRGKSERTVREGSGVDAAQMKGKEKRLDGLTPRTRRPSQQAGW